jgi:predicted RNA-binding Zn-ribbon protein involved in translation (DUF1610 family)
MKVELKKPGEEFDPAQAGKVAKAGDATGTDEVSGHSAIVYFDCPNCGAHLQGVMDVDPQWFVCPDCGMHIHVWA